MCSRQPDLVVSVAALARLGTASSAGRGDRPARHGLFRTDRNDRARLQQRIEDLGALTDQLDLQGPVVTVAHDWGGPISLGWAEQHRDQLAGIVLMNTAVHQPAASPAPRLIRMVRTTGILDKVCVATPTFVRAATALSRPRIPRSIRRGVPGSVSHCRAAGGDRSVCRRYPAERRSSQPPGSRRRCRGPRTAGRGPGPFCCGGLPTRSSPISICEIWPAGCRRPKFTDSKAQATSFRKMPTWPPPSMPGWVGWIESPNRPRPLPSVHRCGRLSTGEPIAMR